MPQKILIAANWKMNVLPSECKALAIAITDVEWPEQIEVLICPPHTHLQALQDIRKDGIFLGAQNCHAKSKGPYTGEISAEMLKDLNCDYVIIGHSERRAMNPNEDDEISSKLQSALSNGLKVIYCCGESLQTREAGGEKEFVRAQLERDLLVLPHEYLKNVTIAYEPIWAIGTGQHATPQQASEMHAFIRQTIKDQIGKSNDSILRILYGGSVNSKNAASLAAMPEINGVLVGGASLIPVEFKAIIKAFS
jgi:triosephosphate isomerase